MRVFLASLSFTLLCCAPAQAVLTFTRNWTVNSVIPDNDPLGFQDSHVLSNGSLPFTTIGSVSVSLVISKISSTATEGWNGDLYAYLVHRDGFSVLLNRVGSTTSNPAGFSDAGMNVTLSDTASQDIHTAGIFSGTFLPDAREADPLAVTDLSPRTADLSSMRGLAADGTWTLFVADLASGDQLKLVSWGITVSDIPEPSSILAIGTPLLLAGGLVGRRRHSPV